MSATTKPMKRQPPLTVFIERARCPFCGECNLHTRRSTQGGDGSISRNTQCRACKKVFIVVVE